MGTLQNDRRRRRRIFFTCFKNIWNCSRYVMLQSHGQVPARYHSLLGIFGKFEVAYVHSLTLSSMIFFVAAYRGANVSCSQDGQGRSASIPLGVTGCTKVPYASSWPPASRRWRRTALPLLYPHFLGPVGPWFSGWWFQTWLLYFPENIWGCHPPTIDELHHFSSSFCREFVWNDDIMEKMAQFFWTFFPSWCFQTGIFSDEAWNLGGAPIFRKKNIPSGYLTVCHGKIHHF